MPESTPAQGVAAEIREAVQVHSLPLTALLKKMGVSVAVFYRWESGDVYSPKFSTYQNVSRVLRTLENNDSGQQAVAASIADEQILPITRAR